MFLSVKHLHSRSELLMREDHSLTPQVLQLRLTAWKNYFPWEASHQLHTPQVWQWSAGRYKQTQGKRRDFLGIIAGSEGFANLPILRTFKTPFPFILCCFPETYSTANSALGRTAFVPPEWARVDIDLKGTHTVTRQQLDNDAGITYRISWSSLGVRRAWAPNSMFLPMESSDTPREGYGHSACCWILYFRTQITPPLTARHWHPFLILQGCFT